MAGMGKKSLTKAKIINYVINHHTTSKVELSKNLNISMPTVLSNVNELQKEGVIVEEGEYESTGGRKAKQICINASYRYAIGVMITREYVTMSLLNLRYEVEKKEKVELAFSSDLSYCTKLAEVVDEFMKNLREKDKILGIGISIPGIISQEEKLVTKSHALQLENYSLSFLEQAFSFPVYFENDANAAMMAEDLNLHKDAVYISLNTTLGGAFCVDGKLYHGQNQKAGEFGHMILRPDGRRCYCGKKGCADAYCSARALVDESQETVEEFMKKVKEGDSIKEKKFEEYLNNLAIMISNLRMAYDTEIIVGGEVGGYLEEYMLLLGKKVMEYNGFDRDVRYLKNCLYKKDEAAIGVAKHFLYEFINNI